jgi:hypothetical protein
MNRYDLRRISKFLEEGLSSWVLHDHYAVRGSVFDRTLQTSPAKAAAGDALHHRGRERAGALGPDLQGLPARRRPERCRGNQSGHRRRHIGHSLRSTARDVNEEWISSLRGLGETRSAHQRIRLQRVTILRNVLRDLKPTLIVDAPAGQNRSSFDHEAIASPVLVWRLLDVRNRKPGGNDGIASSDRV